MAQDEWVLYDVQDAEGHNDNDDDDDSQDDVSFLHRHVLFLKLTDVCVKPRMSAFIIPISKQRTAFVPDDIEVSLISSGS